MRLSAAWEPEYDASPASGVNCSTSSARESLDGASPPVFW